jgi:hypothetical protein
VEYRYRPEFLHVNLARTDVRDCVIRVIGSWIGRLVREWSWWSYTISPIPYGKRADPNGKIVFDNIAGL